MEPGLEDYIWDYHRDLASEVETKAWRHIHGTIKMGDKPSEARIRLMKERFLTDDADALALVALGFPEFRRRVVNSIREKHGNSIAVNRCPKCNGVCRTPQAKQCRFCHHDWH